MIETPLSKEQIDKILSYLPYFKTTQEFYRYETPKWKEDFYIKEGFTATPVLVEDEKLKEFRQIIIDTKFCVAFDWMHWEAGKEILMKPERIDNLDFLTLRMLLTAILRYDRFFEGAFAIAAQNRSIFNILSKLKSL